MNGSGVALIVGWADRREAKGRGAICASEGLSLPDVAIKAMGAAVQVIGRLVGRELEDLAVERKLCAGDAAGYPTGDGPKVGVRIEVVPERVEPEDDVGEISTVIGDADRSDDRAEGDDIHRGEGGWIHQGVAHDLESV